MNSPKLGIALLPDATTMQTMIALQQQLLAICPLQPLLSTQTNQPHMTLLQGRFSDGDAVQQAVLQLQQRLQKQAHNQPEILCFRQLQWLYQPPGWYFWQPLPDAIGHQAHQFCFAALKPLMQLTAIDRQKDRSGYTASELFNYTQYGYRYIGSDFHPHFTLGQTLTRQPSAAINRWLQTNLPQPVPTSSKFERITLYRLGIAGSHAESLLDAPIAP